MTSLLPIFQKKLLFLISLVYFVIAFGLLFYFGINNGGEAFKYLLDAKSITQNNRLSYGEFSYFFLTYSLFLSFFIKFKISLWVVGIFQLLLSYAAAYSLYKLVLNKSANYFVSVFIFFSYLFSYLIQKWNFFIYSESIHTSLVVIGFCVFVNLLHKYSTKNLIYFIVLSIAIITTRPVGVLFLLAAYLTFMYNCFSKKQHRIVWLSLVIGVVLCTAVLNSPVRYFINPDSLKRMELICMVPQEGSTAVYTQFNRTGIIGAFKVIKNDIGFSNFFTTGIQKLKLFFGIVRPYYSLRNNIFLATNWLFYPFVFIGIFFNRHKEYTLIKTFSILILLITSAGIFVTCDDWSNRFIAPVFPFVIVLATQGLYTLIKIEKYFNKKL